jgi:hypothetical protein
MLLGVKGPQLERVTIDASLSTQLGESPSPVTLFDPSGLPVGLVVPNKTLYANLNCPIGDEEFERRAREGGGRPLAAILADLEATYGPAES